jgi:hypothetical protein
MSLVEDVRRQVQARLRELKPLMDEYQQLEAMAQSLNTDNGTAPTAPRTRARAGTPSGNGRRGRRQSTGTRAQQALALVKQHPGITIPELAKSMGIKQNYLYRVLPGLAEEGKLVRDGHGWRTTD